MESNMKRSRKIFISIVIIVMFILLNGCTDQSSTRFFGGTSTIELEKGKKLVNITWKDEDIWVLTKRMNATDVAETYEFKEHSSYGVMEGTVIIKESK